MTLNYFMARSTQVNHAFEWEKLQNCHLKGKTCRKLPNGLKISDSEKIWTPGVGLPHFGAIFMYITIIFKDLLL